MKILKNNRYQFEDAKVIIKMKDKCDYEIDISPEVISSMVI